MTQQDHDRYALSLLMPNSIKTLILTRIVKREL